MFTHHFSLALLYMDFFAFFLFLLSILHIAYGCRHRLYVTIECQHRIVIILMNIETEHLPEKDSMTARICFCFFFPFGELLKIFLLFSDGLIMFNISLLLFLLWDFFFFGKFKYGKKGTCGNRVVKWVN